MAQRLRSSKSHSRLFDWLRDFDKRARRFGRARHISEYPLFYFARFPQLRPVSVGKDRLDKALRTTGYESLSRLLSDCEKEIAARADRALKDLTSAQRIQLTALSVDTTGEIEKFYSRQAAKEWARKRGQEWLRRERMLSSKVESARRTLHDLRRYADRLDPILAFKYRAVAVQALEPLIRLDDSSEQSNDAELLRRLYSDLRELTQNPVPFGMVQLYWLFRTGCGLTGDEAEVRVGLLRNALWKDLGIETVYITVEYREAQSKGCEAVHQAVRQFRPK